jgi:hypothetical protein
MRGSTTHTEGTFKIRRHENGDVEVWAQGWRLEIRFLSLVPALLAVGFALSTIFLPVRMLGCAGLLGAAFVLHRLTEVGIRMDAAGLTFHDLLRTRRIPWDEAVAFMGERTRHDGKLVLLQRDGSTLTAPGSLTGEEMNPIGDEGDLSAVEELNRMMDRFRRGLPVATTAPTPGVVAEPRRRVRAKGPTTRPRAKESPAPQETGAVEVPAVATGSAPSTSVEPPPLRHPHVPRPPNPEPEPEPTGRAARRARRRRGNGSSALIQVPDADQLSPGARLLASFDEHDDRR